MLVPNKWDKTTLGLIRLMVAVKISSASPDAYGLNVGIVDASEKNGVL